MRNANEWSTPSIARGGVFDPGARGALMGVAPEPPSRGRGVRAAVLPPLSTSPPIPPSPERRAAAPDVWETFGPLAPYLMREGVTDLFVTGDGVLWSDGGPRGLHRVDGWPPDPHATRQLATRLIGTGGRHIDESTPYN